MAGTLRLTNTGGASGQTTITAVGTTDRTVTTPDEDGTLLTKDPSGNFAVDGDVQMASLNGGPLAGFRNRLINGDFRIWQRGTNITETLGTGSVKYVSVDRWAFKSSSVTQNVRVARNGNPIAEAPATWAMQLDQATVSLDEVRFIQCIELPRTGYADEFKVGTTWTVSVYSDADLTSRTPSYGFADDSFRTNNVGGGNIESWQSLGGNRYKATFTINVVPVGTSTLFYIFDAPPTGPTTLNYACYQLEPGPVATPFEHRPIGTELALCQRYFFRAPNAFLAICASSGVVSGSSYTNTAQLPVAMRATPTGSNFTSIGGAAEMPTPTAFNIASNVSVGISVAASGNSTAGLPATKWVGFDADAEL
jgi:hypothetical protein